MKIRPLPIIRKNVAYNAGQIKSLHTSLRVRSSMVQHIPKLTWHTNTNCDNSPSPIDITAFSNYVMNVIVHKEYKYDMQICIFDFNNFYLLN